MTTATKTTTKKGFTYTMTYADGTTETRNSKREFSHVLVWQEPNGWGWAAFSGDSSKADKVFDKWRRTFSGKPEYALELRTMKSVEITG